MGFFRRVRNISIMKSDDDFRPKLGKSRGKKSTRKARGLTSLERQVMRAVGKAGGNPSRLGSRRGKTPRTGRYNARGRGAKVMRSLSRDTGWKFDRSSGQRVRMRRVIIKARYVKLKGPQSRAGFAHLRYLQRDGVSRDGEPGKLYGRTLDVPEGRDFLDRSAEDKHQFRIIRVAGGRRCHRRPQGLHARVGGPDGSATWRPAWIG